MCLLSSLHLLSLQRSHSCCVCLLPTHASRDGTCLCALCVKHKHPLNLLAVCIFIIKHPVFDDLKHRCEATDIHRDGPRTITTSYYHSAIGVEVPPWNITTSWTRDLRRFDNIFTGLWVLFQVSG